MNILGRKFSTITTGQINARQDSLEKGIGNSSSDLLYQQTKTPWIRLASAVDIMDNESVSNELVGKIIDLGFTRDQIIGSKLAQNFVLQGGAISINDNATSFTSNKGIDFGTNFTGAYGWGGTSERGAVPMPGITGASVKYINNGALTKTEISIKCFSKNQLALIDLLYMRPGYTVLLEFGWSVYLDNSGNLQQYDGFNSPALRYLFEGAKKDQYKLLKKIKDERDTRFGNYEGVYGKVSNFNWKFNPDGSYDCTVTLVGMGELIESLKINTINLENQTDDGEGAQEDAEAESSGELPLISQATKSSLNNFLYSIYQSNGFWTDPEHEFRDREIKKFCVIRDDGSNIIKTIKIKNAEFHIDIRETDRGKYFQGPQCYITFGYLMAWLQKNILLNNEDIPCCAFDMDFENLQADKNFIKFPKGNISSQPLNCLVPYQSPGITFAAVRKATQIRTSSTSAFFKSLATKYLGYGITTEWPKAADMFQVMNDTIGRSFAYDTNNARLSMVLLNINHIAEVLEAVPEDDDNAKSLNAFLISLIKSINKSTGGINDIVVELNDDQSKIVFRSKTPQKFDKPPAELGEGTLCTFKTFGPGSIIRNLGIDGSIPSNFSAMVTIGAQSNGNQTAGDATSFSNYNAGLIDRIMPVKRSGGSGDGKDDSKAVKEVANIVRIAKMINVMTTAGGFWDRLSGGAGGVWEDVMDDLEWLSEDINTFNANHTQYIQALVGYLSQPVKNGGLGKGEVAFFLPFNFNMEIDGISGIRLFEKFKIDNRALPLSYDSNNVNILVKSVDHDISLTAWTTKIGTISTPAPK